MLDLSTKLYGDVYPIATSYSRSPQQLLKIDMPDDREKMNVEQEVQLDDWLVSSGAS